jgi:hypothetical protein
MEYIAEVYTVNVGGGTLVDFIRLKNGKLLALNDDFACLYDSEAAFYDCDGNVPTIDLRGLPCTK